VTEHSSILKNYVNKHYPRIIFTPKYRCKLSKSCDSFLLCECADLAVTAAEDFAAPGVAKVNLGQVQCNVPQTDIAPVDSFTETKGGENFHSSMNSV